MTTLSSWKKWLLVCVALLVLGGSIARAIIARKAQQTALAQSTESAQARAIALGPRDLHIVGLRALQGASPISGSLVAQRSAIVKAKVAAELQVLHVREGDTVRQGQSLGQLDTQEVGLRRQQAQQQAASAQAIWHNAEQTLRNNQALVQQGFISRQALDTSLSNAASTRANYEAAQAAAQLVDKALQDTRILAPLSGQIAQRFAPPGQRLHVDARIVEIGPGRGTMMADMLRVIARLAPRLYETASVHLVETSPALQAVQRETLSAHGERIRWHTSFDEVPEGFTLIAANELFDAIPIRQFVKTPTGFRERMVGLDAEGWLGLAAGVATLAPAWLPPRQFAPPDGEIFEVAPARQAVMTTLGDRLRTCHGTALVIDYGHMVSGFGDTLQAVLAHAYDPPLAHPGMADLTSHVDFENLARTALAAGVHVNGCMYQGDFLVGLGIEDRATSLGRGKDEQTQADIVKAVERLAGAGEGRMGELFKVLAISSPAVNLPPFKGAN